MNKSIKKLISITCIIPFIFLFGITTVYAATLHKTNGIYVDSGAGAEYTTTTTKTCSRLTAKGYTHTGTNKEVSVHVYYKNLFGIEVPVANAYLTLNGSEVTLTKQLSGSYSARTYIVRITTSDNKAYELSTYFYE